MNPNIPEGTTVCSVCEIEQDNNEFSWYTTRFTKNGNRLRVNTNCKSCQKINAKALREAKKTSPEKPPIGAPCDCCGKPVMKNWQLDHDHNTGLFRGWLCKDCNVGMGKLGDTIEGLQKALDYLKKGVK